jgi:hypothetical protein
MSMRLIEESHSLNLQPLRRLIAIVVVIAAFSALKALAANNNMLAAALASITEDKLYRHVEVLADDVYEGRAAGSRGGHAAAQYVLEQLKPEGMTPAGDNNGFVQTFNDDCRNILVLLPGDDPVLAKEVVVVGAHYDHVGYGKSNNSYGPYGQIHNGADDNASGTAALLETIDAFSQSGLKTRRSVLFAFWDAEENGLVGSKYWLTHPTVDIDRIKLDITIDMIGRLRDERLLLLGTRSGYGMRRLFCDSVEDPMWLDFSWDLKANSDHWPFIEHGIPIALLHTGLHSDYHRPTDDVEKINRAGLREVCRYLFTAIVTAANDDALPRFREAVKQETEKMHHQLEQPASGVSLTDWPANLPPPRLGITWQEDEAEPNSVFLTRVVAGTPAAAAGLQVGDRIDELEGKPFADGTTLHDSIHALLDAGSPEIKLLIERRGHLRTVALEVGSSKVGSKAGDNSAVAPSQ